MSSPQLLRDKARQCHEIAEGVADAQIFGVLHKVANWFQDQADKLAEAFPATEPDILAPPVVEPTPRKAERKAVKINATLRRQGESKFNATLADLSETGFRVESHYLIPEGAQVWLTLPGLAAIPATVAWSSGHSLGCRFEAPLHPAVLDRVIAAGSR